MTTTPTLREQYDARIGTNIIDQLFKAMTTTRYAVLGVTSVIMATNYTHQAEFFARHGAGISSYALPMVCDVLTVAFMKIRKLRGIPASSRRIAGRLMLIPAAGSSAISFFGGGDLTLRIVFAALVLAVVIGDYGVSLIKPDFAEMEKTVEEVAAPAAAPVEVDPGEEAKREARREYDRNRYAAKVAKAKADAAAQAQADADRKERRRIAEATKRAEVAAASDDAIRDLIDNPTPANAPTSPAPAHPGYL